MEKINDGGPAFPNRPEMTIDSPGCGMTLRDYFAAKSMQGFCADHSNTEMPEKAIAIAAYMMADAMIAVRQRKIES